MLFRLMAQVRMSSFASLVCRLEANHLRFKWLSRPLSLHTSAIALPASCYITGLGSSKAG